MLKNWYVRFGLILVTTSAVLYTLHFQLFHDLHHIFLYLVGDVAFVPIEVLLVSMVIHKVIEKKEQKERIEKTHMLLGVFFSELGRELLGYISSLDTLDINTQKMLTMNLQWEDKDFDDLRFFVEKHQSDIVLAEEQLQGLATIIHPKRSFLVTMLQNPVLLDHDEFSSLIKIIFHVDEEFTFRYSKSKHIEEYGDHLKADIEKAYKQLLIQWVSYMNYLKSNYPNLFNFTMDCNPFFN